jgi:catechol 2,3-dioxygenase-like lactoylglutathione lyase family enzyme
MKRFHVHVAVRNLQESIRFYSTMFGVEPSVLKPDYAKWMLDDPRVNFAISERAQVVGVNHLGVQADTDEELDQIHANLVRADQAVVAEKGVHCCYAHSDKYWIKDPQGIAWESFRSFDAAPLAIAELAAPAGACGSGDTSCCAPAAEAGAKTATACCP